ncbi:MAG TPA: prepilin peptidase [Terracidiphilus sp.]|jgi:leader peptidase (prepilin peptidase)/N-methyltransferase
MIRILGTVFAALAGLAFGSFLNVCVTRWPEEESTVTPRSHCRNCSHILAWWENVPVVSWIALRGRCRSCRAWIGWRYPLAELAVAALWAALTWRFLGVALDPSVPAISPALHWNLYNELGRTLTLFIFFWTLIAIAILDAEYLWIPDWLTVPGILLGIASEITYRIVGDQYSDALLSSPLETAGKIALRSVAGVLAAAALILLIRWIYRLTRKREGIGLGDAKLMAMLAAWLGFGGALLAFGIGVVLGAAVGLAVLALPSSRAAEPGSWALRKLPLGAFLCVGGIVSGLWGEPLIAAYLRWAGF